MNEFWYGTGPWQVWWTTSPARHAPAAQAEWKHPAAQALLLGDLPLGRAGGLLREYAQVAWGDRVSARTPVLPEAARGDWPHLGHHLGQLRAADRGEP